VTPHRIRPLQNNPSIDPMPADAWVDNACVAHQGPPAFQPLTGIYEPSAIQQLPDGRFHDLRRSA